MSKGKRKTKRRGQEDPVLGEQPLEESENNHKNLLDLTAEELKKEAFKLGLYKDGDKPRKDQALTKLTAFLSRNSINVETFKFSPNGATQFPAPLLAKNRTNPKETPSKTSSSESSSGSGSDSDEPSLAKTPNLPVTVQKKKKKSRANKTSNYGYETVMNPVTGVPVGIVSRTTGQFFSVSTPGSSPVVTSVSPPPVQQLPASLVTSGHNVLTGTAAGLLSQPPHNSEASTTTSSPSSNTNLDICGISVPGFAHNKTQHTASG